MKKTIQTIQPTKSKKAASQQRLNAGISESMGKRTNFDLVVAGVCPHDESSLSAPVSTKGSGEKATCVDCGHTWYINKKIRTCKCLTCSDAREKPQVTELAERGGTSRKSVETRARDSSMHENSGGPLWSRTTDLSLIRSEVYAANIKTHVNLRNYLDLWSSEQKLKGIVDTTIYGYRRKVEALLGECPNPNEFNIKQYLAKKQECGAMSGTIANYVKAYRSFFGYLYNKGLYNIDPHCLPLPKIRNREKRVPSNEDVAKLLSVVNNAEDKIALLLLVDTGIRVQELATIKVKNINLNDTTILINGKGGKSRTVYLSETTVEHLRAYIQTLKDEYLFPSTRADAKSVYRNRTYFERRLRELCEQAGIERMSPHQLRHYFATYTLSRGGDIKAVSEMLGHADVGITLRIYHHVNAKVIREMHLEYSPLRELSTIGATATGWPLSNLSPTTAIPEPSLPLSLSAALCMPSKSKLTIASFKDTRSLSPAM